MGKGVCAQHFEGGTDKAEYCQFDFDKSSTESPPFSWQILITPNYVIVPTGDELV